MIVAILVNLILLKAVNVPAGHVVYEAWAETRVTSIAMPLSFIHDTGLRTRLELNSDFSHTLHSSSSF